MKKEANISIIICDSCDTQEILGDAGDVETEEVPVGWFHGTVTSGDDQDAAVVPWSACKRAHIKRAVLVALDLE
jgi:hypothetical protein